MIKDAEHYEEEDQAIRKRIIGLNNYQNFISSIRSQISDQDGLGGKLSSEDKKIVQASLKESEEWLEENSNGQVEAEELEDHLSELQASIGHITLKIYGSEADDEVHYGHGEEL